MHTRRPLCGVGERYLRHLPVASPAVIGIPPARYLGSYLEPGLLPHAFIAASFTCHQANNCTPEGGGGVSSSVISAVGQCGAGLPRAYTLSDILVDSGSLQSRHAPSKMHYRRDPFESEPHLKVVEGSWRAFCLPSAGGGMAVTFPLEATGVDSLILESHRAPSKLHNSYKTAHTSAVLKATLGSPRACSSPLAGGAWPLPTYPLQSTRLEAQVWIHATRFRSWSFLDWPVEIKDSIVMCGDHLHA